MIFFTKTLLESFFALIVINVFLQNQLFVKGINSLEPGCKTSKLDIAFLIDSSDDVDATMLGFSKNFMKDIINSFDVSSTTVRTSVSIYGSDVTVLNNLTEIGEAGEVIDSKSSKSKKEDIISRTLAATPVGGARRVGHALSYICDNVFQMNAGKDADSQRSVPKIIVILSSGESDDDIPHDLSCLNQRSSFNQYLYDVSIIGLGLGRSGVNSLNNKAVNKVLPMRGIESLLILGDDVVKYICAAAIYSCPIGNYDLMFLLDGSASRNEFESMKKYVIDVISQFEVDVNMTRVGVVYFGEEPHTVFDLSTYTQFSQVVNAIQSIEAVEEIANPERAIRHVVQQAFTEMNGARFESPELLIYITSSNSADEGELKAAVDELHFSGVVVNAIGIGSGVDQNQLQSIASSPASHHVIAISNFTELSRTKGTLINNMCKSLLPSRPFSVIDLQFIVHSSTAASEDPQYRFTDSHLKTWIKQVIDRFYVGQHYSRFGLTTFAEKPTLEFSFDQYLSKDELFEAIDNLDTLVNENSASIGAMLNFTFGNMTQQIRSGSKQVVVVLTDERSADDVTMAANSFRLNDIPVFSVGFGERIDETELQQIATKPAYVITVSDGVNSLDKVTSNLASYISDATREVCDDIELDIQFLLDGSTSINSENFFKIKEWMKSLISTFDIGVYTNRVGLNQYSDDPVVEFPLNHYFTKESLFDAVDDVSYKKGRTRIGKAINFTREFSLIESAGARPFVKKILLVMTDGQSQDSIVEAAQLLHAMELVRTYAIGVSEASLPELRTIASDPDSKYMYKVDDFDAINTIRSSLIQRICEEGNAKITCPVIEMDAIFLIDAYIGSREQAFTATKQFLIKLVRSFEVGSHASRFAVVQYSDEQRVEINFVDYDSSQSVIEAINAISRLRVTQHHQSLLGEALLNAGRLFKSKSLGSREQVPKALFVITASTSYDDPSSAAASLAQDGVDVFVIGGGARFNQLQMQQIVTSPPPQHFFPINRFHQISKLERSLMRSICSAMTSDCKNHLVDIIFLVDSSSAGSPKNLRMMKEFLLNVVQKFEVDTSTARIAVHGLWDLNTYKSLRSLTTAINGIERFPENSLTSEPLRPVLEDAFSAERGGRKNVRSIALLISDKVLINLVDVDEVAAMSEIQRITLGIGNSLVLDSLASSPKNLYSFYVESYDKVLDYETRIARRICEDSKCPVLFKEEEVISGVDLLENYGVKNGSADGTLEENGIRKDDVAYRVVGWRANLSVPKSASVPTRCLYYFTLISIVNMRKKTSQRSDWDIIKITDDLGNTEVSVTCRGRSKDFVISRKGGDNLIIKNNISTTFFNRKWHKLEIQFGRNEIRVYIDCYLVGSYQVDLPMDQLLNKTGHIVTGSYDQKSKSPTFSLQELLLKFHNGWLPAKNPNELCCELKRYKNRRCRRDVPNFTPPTPTEPTPAIPHFTVRFETTPSTIPSTTHNPSGVEGPGIVEHNITQNCSCQSIVGPPGAVGDKGVKGDVGPSGPPGLPGYGSESEIILGPPGPKGEKGEVGRNGINGVQKGWTQRISGERMRQIAREVLNEVLATELPIAIANYMDTYVNGLSNGERGRPGPAGPRGFPGSPGPIGPMGPRGDRGSNGAQGVPGMIGRPGEHGKDGQKGANGVGSVGPPGPQGPRGPPGMAVHGQPGERGPSGRQGRAGRDGPRGYQGKTGPPGYCDSRYCHQAVIEIMSNNDNSNSRFPDEFDGK